MKYKSLIESREMIFLQLLKSHIESICGRLQLPRVVRNHSKIAPEYLFNKMLKFLFNMIVQFNLKLTNVLN